MVSVNNNPSAILALQMLRETQTDLSATQGRVSSGLKIANARDGAAAYNMATSLRNRIATQENIREGISRVQSLGDVTLNAAQSLQKIIIEMRDKATSVASGTLNANQIAAYNAEFNALRDQIAPLLNAASFNGINLINGPAGVSVNVRVNDLDFGLAANQITITSQNLTAAGLAGVGGAAAAYATVGADFAAQNVGNITVDATGAGFGIAGYGAISNAIVAAVTLSAALLTVNTFVAGLGAKLNALGKQNDYNLKLSDTLNKAVSDLVDADLAEESAKLQALQTKQQLGVQVLGVANQAPQVLLSLFR